MYLSGSDKNNNKTLELISFDAVIAVVECLHIVIPSISSRYYLVKNRHKNMYRDLLPDRNFLHF